MVTIKSPCSGTFYTRPNATQPPYAMPGQRLFAEMPVCLITTDTEAVEVVAGADGTLVRLLRVDGGPVAKGEPLAEIDVAGGK
jgi:biotin carboxyl carrier protein